MPSTQNQIQIVDTHETSETLAVTCLQRVGHQIYRTLLEQTIDLIAIRLPAILIKMRQEMTTNSDR
jgi:hypothetical protein